MLETLKGQSANMYIDNFSNEFLPTGELKLPLNGLDARNATIVIFPKIWEIESRAGLKSQLKTVLMKIAINFSNGNLNIDGINITKLSDYYAKFFDIIFENYQHIEAIDIFEDFISYRFPYYGKNNKTLKGITCLNEIMRRVQKYVIKEYLTVEEKLYFEIKYFND